MRTTLRLVSLMALAFIPRVSFAFASSGCDSTTAANGEHTVASSLHIAAFHVDLGGGPVTLGDSMAYGGYRFAVGVCGLPNWTFGLGGQGGVQRTPYVVDNNYHPQQYVSAWGVDAQRTWNSNATFHPIAIAGIGSLRSEYMWVRTVNGQSTSQSAGRATSGYASVAAGGELNVFHWMRADLTGGYRYTGALNSPQAQPYVARGGFISFMLGFGKF